MTGNMPLGRGEGPAIGPPTGPWSPNYPGSPAPGSRTSRGAVLTAVAIGATAAVAVAALIVAFARPTATNTSTTNTTPTYTSAQTAAAQQQVCDTYKLVARAVQVDTAGTDKALARIADTNGAVMLDIAAANPALDGTHRDAARALSTAYATVTAKGNGMVATDAEYQAAIDDVIAKDSAMKRVCGGS
ncbi:hypothetical protein [Mycobacterium paraffinicum]|uniref:hypothetical protein n=1 Tax=Mycobacterium paraffinicum TaxID=53378 RepID=UPI0021F32A9F|nr:hypothetical protein [Mycobacterium paraffinicum]MCV7310753.1 hypothetical protein [Mycobacterium paraffinicum]